MLGSGQATPLPPYVQILQPQVAQPIVTEQIGAGTQDHADTDPTLQHAVDKDTDKDSSGLVLPLARIKRIIKSEGDVKAVSSEASFAVARAAELLLEELARRANVQMQSQHRSTLQYKDVATVVHDWKALLFLSDIVPQPVAVSTLLEKYRQQHPELVHQQTNGTAIAPAAAVGQQQAQQVAQQPAQQPAQQLAQQLAQHAHQHAQPMPVQQRPAQSIFSQSQVQNAHAQNPIHGQQLGQLVHPRMQHFPVAEQVQHLLPPRLPLPTAVSQASTSQKPSLNQYQSLGQLQGLLSQQQALVQQQALAQQAKQHALAQQAVSQPQASGQQTLGQQLLAQQQAFGQQHAMSQQQQQAVSQQQQAVSQQQQQALAQQQQQAILQQQQQQQQAMLQQQQQQPAMLQQQQQQQQQQQAMSQQQSAGHEAVGQLQAIAHQGEQ